MRRTLRLEFGHLVCVTLWGFKPAKAGERIKLGVERSGTPGSAFADNIEPAAAGDSRLVDGPRGPPDVEFTRSGARIRSRGDKDASSSSAWSLVIRVRLTIPKSLVDYPGTLWN